MIEERRKALLMMGYRCMTLGNGPKWGKPVGSTLFTYEDDREEFTCWFKGNGTMQRWDHSNYRGVELDGQFLAWIKYAETWHARLDAGAYGYGANASFEFLDPLDALLEQEEQDAQAARGWHCENCQHSNRAGDPDCTECGRPLNIEATLEAIKNTVEVDWTGKPIKR
jgi:hypothetical protein